MRCSRCRRCCSSRRSTGRLPAGADRSADGHRPEDLLLPRPERVRDVHRRDGLLRRIGRCTCSSRPTRGMRSRAPARRSRSCSALIVLVTGPLWAAKAWGYFWTWDPRLTTALLAGSSTSRTACCARFSGDGAGERKFAAALGILGAANLPIIHYSVQKWGGQHPTVVTGKGGGLQHPDMKIAFALAMTAFTCLRHHAPLRARAARARAQPPRPRGRRRHRPRPRRSNGGMMLRSRRSAPPAAAAAPGRSRDRVQGGRRHRRALQRLHADGRGVRRHLAHHDGLARHGLAQAQSTLASRVAGLKSAVAGAASKRAGGGATEKSTEPETAR